MEQEGMKVLFVCLGNTCRSPMAEAIFNRHLKERGLDNWSCDSAGLENWHAGKPPNRRTLAIMQKYSIHIDHIARKIRREDFTNFDIIFGMDFYNMWELDKRAPRNCKSKLEPFCAYDPLKELEIEDPYCDIGMEGFEKCYEQCVRCTNGFLDKYSKIK